jgi:putative membrane protein
VRRHGRDDGCRGGRIPWLLILLWTLLGVVVTVTGGVVMTRVLSSRPQPDRRQLRSAESAGVDQAQAALRLRYARGEISREDYLQGRVELED